MMPSSPSRTLIMKRALLAALVAGLIVKINGKMRKIISNFHLLYLHKTKLVCECEYIYT